jgi:hypothetical protein
MAAQEMLNWMPLEIQDEFGAIAYTQLSCELLMIGPAV